ncbi:peptidoglycan-recognition protein SA-like isoform X1 [Pieris napi]|nr:peptidoglycan-recognition protein SA-like isoform X1 [Pieris napi]
MWTENDDRIEERVRNGLGAVNSVAVNDDRIAPVPSAAAATPSISNLNVNNSKKVHIGPKFVSVTQNVQNQEVVKGRFLGLELVSPNNARTLRCSVAVFVCWAFLVASGLAIYLLYMTLLKHQTRLDIELSFPKYLWDIVKNSSRTERLSCAVAIMVLIVCIALIVYFAGLSANTSESPIDKAPHEWRITREMWLARPYNYTHTLDAFEPLMLVIFQHTVSPQCSLFKNCAAELRNLQGYFISHYDYDIPYNFLVGNDGRVYEGRGWNIEGAHTFGYNRCSIGIGFIGDYRGEIESHASVTKAQLNRTRMLLEEGVRLGHLRKDFLVIGANYLGPTASPGSILNNALKQWPNYDHKNRFYKLNCEKMEEKFGNTTLY